MLIIEALGALQFLKKELINLSDIGNALGIGRAAMSGRLQRKSELKPDEIKQLEVYFGVDIEDFVRRNSAPENISSDIKDEIIKTVEEYLKTRGI